jgi:hypothetical protein
MKKEKFLGWNLFRKLVTGTKKNDVFAMFSLSWAAARLEFSFENAAGIWNFPCFIEFYCTLQSMNKIQRMLVFIFYCTYSYYAYCKKTFKSAARSSGRVKFFLSERRQVHAAVKKLEVTLDMWYRYGQIVIKQILRRLTVVIILKNFSKRRLHCLINRRGSVRVT